MPQIKNNINTIMAKDEKMTHSTMMKAMEWAYDKAVCGIPGFDSAEEIADSYMDGDGSLRDKANSLIRWQNTKAATSGFATGLGGFTTMAITLPANVVSVLYIQIRMIAAIAILGGYDVKDDRVKTLVYSCLVANSASEVLKNIGIQITNKLAMSALRNISGATITKINQAIGFKLLTKFGSKGIINLGKAIPLAGGVVGAAFDGITTNKIGNVARDTFIPKE